MNNNTIRLVLVHTLHTSTYLFEQDRLELNIRPNDHEIFIHGLKGCQTALVLTVKDINRLRPTYDALVDVLHFGTVPVCLDMSGIEESTV